MKANTVMNLILDRTKNNNCSATLKKIIPEGSIINSYAFYDGAMEFSLANDRRFVNATTTSFPVYNFWMCLMHDAERLHDMISSDQLKFEGDEVFSVVQDMWHKHSSPFIKASLFFIMNRCSSTGLISSGEINYDHLTPVSIAKLKSFHVPEDFHLNYDKNSSLTSLVKRSEPGTYNLIPAGNFNYGLFEHGKSVAIEETKINHREMIELCKTNSKVVLVYNYDKRVPIAFKDNRVILIDKYGNQTTKEERTQGVIVANF